MSAAANLALTIPAFIYSAGILALIALALHGLGLTAWAVGLVVVWLLPGPLLFVRPAENAFCRIFLRLRRPTPSEHDRLLPLWNTAATAVGVDASKFTLWIEESDDTNAYAAAGHVVGVTRWALETLPPGQLTAILAHELGHHLGGHSWTKLLFFWYSLPGRLASKLVIGLIAAFWRTGVDFILSNSREKANTGCFMLIIMSFFGLFLLIAAYTIVRVNPFFLLFFAAILAMPVLLAYLRRRSEFQADLLATRIGYGQTLVEVYQTWLAQGDDQARKSLSKRQQLLESHPSCAERISEIEKYLSNR